jgi:hypothetical protein
MQEPVRFLLLYVVMPVWLAAGVADWACHRRAGIADTSGPMESVLHLLMVAQVGLGVLAAMFFEINAAVLLLLLLLVLAHTLTTHLDLHYTDGKRHVSAFEQSVHGYLEAMPMTAYALLAAAYWPQLQAVFGAGDTQPDWRFVLKEDPLATPHLVVLLIASLSLGAAPFAEELYRTLSARRQARDTAQPGRAL